MKTQRNRSYLWSLAFGLVLTVLLAFAVLPLRHTSARYLSDVFNNRGPLQYISLFIGFSVLAFSALAHLRGDFRKRLIVAVMVFSLFPLAPGYLAYRLGIAVMEQQYNTAIAANPSAEDIADIERGRSLGFALCLYMVAIAGLMSMGCFVSGVFLWIRKGSEVEVTDNDNPTTA